MTDRRDEDSEVRCKHCGERGLWWEEVDYGLWHLVDEDGVVHKCPARTALPGMFQPMED